MRADSGKVVFQASGDDTEELKRVAVDLTAHLNQEIFIRLVDQHSRAAGATSTSTTSAFMTRSQRPGFESYPRRPMNTHMAATYRPRKPPRR